MIMAVDIWLTRYNYAHLDGPIRCATAFIATVGSVYNESTVARNLSIYLVFAIDTPVTQIYELD